MREADHLRRAFWAFRRGAGLRSADVARLMRAGGREVSNNRLREMGRDSDRGASISAEELRHLIEAWADEEKGHNDSATG